MEKIVVRQLFRNLDRYANQIVELNGWVRNNRAQKSFGFLMVNDGSFFETIQVVYEENLENFKRSSKVPCWFSSHSSWISSANTRC